MFDHKYQVNAEDFRQIWPNAYTTAMKAVGEVVLDLDVQLEHSRKLIGNHVQAQLAFDQFLVHVRSDLSHIKNEISAAGNLIRTDQEKFISTIRHEAAQLTQQQSAFLRKLIEERDALNKSKRELEAALNALKRLPVVKRLWKALTNRNVSAHDR